MTTDNLNYLHCLTNASFGKLHLTAKWYSISNRKVLHEWQLGEEEEEKCVLEELSKKFNIHTLASGYLFSLLPVIVEHEKEKLKMYNCET